LLLLLLLLVPGGQQLYELNIASYLLRSYLI
jgi:hypothetical protein